MNTENSKLAGRAYSSLLSDLKAENLLPLIHEELLHDPGILISHQNALDVINDSNAHAEQRDAVAGHLLPDVVTSLLNLKANHESTTYPVRFLYAPDPYDIVHFSFPFGFRYNQNPEAKELDKLADQQQAWESLFLLSDHPLILLDEYRSELARLRNRMIFDQDVHNEEINVFSRLIEDLYRGHNRTEEQIEELGKEIFDRRLPLLLSILSGEANHGLKRFQDILRKLIINDDQLDERVLLPDLKPEEQERHINTIRTIFSDTRAGNLANERYQHHIQRLRSEPDDFRKNKIRTDFDVMDRVLLINLEFKAAAPNLRCQYIVLYLSSTPRSIKEAKYLPDNSLDYLGKPFNFIRDVNQLYAQYLFTNTFAREQQLHKGRHIEGLTRTESIGLLSIALNVGVNRKEFEETINKEPNLKLHLERRLDNFEWYSVANNPNSYRQELLDAYKQLKGKSLFEPLRLALERFKEAVNNSHNYRDQLKETLRHHSIEVTFLRKRINLLGQHKLSVRPTGAVVGINHHLPILFNFSEKAPAVYQEWIQKTTQLILRSKGANNSEALRKHSNELYKFLLKDDSLPDFQPDALIQSRQIIANYERQTLLYLISMLIPKQEKTHTTKSNSNSEESLLNDYDLDSEYNYVLSDDVAALAERLAKPATNLSAQEKEEYTRVLQNLRYIWVWSLRRAGSFVQSVQIASAAQSQATADDPRFRHGLALAYFSMVDQQRKSGIDTQNQGVWGRIVLEAIQCASSALAIYNASTEATLATQKMHSAIINTLVYLYIVHYEITKNRDPLRSARLRLDQNDALYQDDRQTLPECLHTEALLEFYEGCEARVSGNVPLSQVKFVAAQITVQRCIEQDQKFNPDDEDPDYRDLANKIIRELTV